MKFLRKKAASRLAIDPDQSILDIATGTGAQGVEFARLGHEVVGIDLDLKMLDKARLKITRNLAFLHGDATRLPLAAGKFDLAVISFAMHDVPYTIGIHFLKEARRVIKDTGLICIIEHEDPADNVIAKVFFLIALLFETPNHKTFFRKSLEDYFGETGLELVGKTRLALGAVRLVTAVKST